MTFGEGPQVGLVGRKGEDFALNCFLCYCRELRDSRKAGAELKTLGLTFENTDIQFSRHCS